MAKYIGAGNGGIPGFNPVGTPAIGKFVGYNGTNPEWQPETFNDIASRNAITSKFEGMIAYVKSTQCYYVLDPDLSTWQFIDSNPNLRNQAQWFVNSVSGDDNNDGKSSGSALKTLEELSQRLCPWFRKTVFKTQVTVSLAAGIYGALSLNVDWDSSVSSYGAAVSIQGDVTSSAPMTITAVVNTVDGSVRGQLTSSSGSFTPQGRIRSTSGANIGAITYSTGQNANAQNHFVKHWFNYNTTTVVNIANGTTVVTDVLNTTINKLNLQCYDSGYIEIVDCKLPNGGNFPDFTSNFRIFLAGCEVSGSIYQDVSMQNCKITGSLFCSIGFQQLWGCEVLSKITSGPGSYLEVNLGNCCDGGGLSTLLNTPTDADGGGNIIIATGGVEYENGVSTYPAIDIAPFSIVSNRGPLWGLSANYGIGVRISSTSQLVTGTVSQVAIPATQQVQLTGQNFTYSQMPRTIPRAQCGFCINPDTSAISQTL